MPPGGTQKVKPDDKGWHFSKDPARYIPCKCDACNRCWFDLKHQRCVYGGPFND